MQVLVLLKVAASVLFYAGLGSPCNNFFVLISTKDNKIFEKFYGKKQAKAWTEVSNNFNSDDRTVFTAEESAHATLENCENPPAFIITAETIGARNEDWIAQQIVNRLTNESPDEKWIWRANAINPPKSLIKEGAWTDFEDKKRMINTLWKEHESQTFKYVAIWYADSKPMTYKSIVLLASRDSYKPFTVNFTNKLVTGVKKGGQVGYSVTFLVPRRSFFSVPLGFFKKSIESIEERSFAFFIGSPMTLEKSKSIQLPAIVVSAVPLESCPTYTPAEYDNMAKNLVGYLSLATSSTWEYKSSHIVPPNDFDQSAQWQTIKCDIAAQSRNGGSFEYIVIWFADVKSMTYKSSVVLNSDQFQVEASIKVAYDTETPESFAYSDGFANNFAPTVRTKNSQNSISDGYISLDGQWSNSKKTRKDSNSSDRSNSSDGGAYHRNSSVLTSCLTEELPNPHSTVSFRTKSEKTTKDSNSSDCLFGESRRSTDDGSKIKNTPTVLSSTHSKKSSKKGRLCFPWCHATK